MKQGWWGCGLNRLSNRLRLCLQARDVLLKSLLGCAFSSGANNDTSFFWNDALKNVLQSGPLSIRQLTADAGHRTVGHINQVPTR